MKQVLIACDVYQDGLGKKCGEWESEASLHELRKTIESLGYQAIESRTPQKTISLLNEITVSERNHTILWNWVEGFESRNREAYIPSLAEFLGFPHTGSDAYAQIVSLDKFLCKSLLDGSSPFATPSILWDETDSIKKILDLPFPWFIKPNFEGSSIGIGDSNIIHSQRDFEERCRSLLSEFGSVIIEQYLPGKDITIGVLGNFPDYTVSKPAYVLYPGATYSETIKAKDSMPESLDFSVPKEIQKSLEEFCVQFCKQLKVRGYARLDFREDKAGIPKFLEINLTPGLSAIYSTFPKLWSKVPYPELISKILNLAIKSFEKDNRFQYGKSRNEN